MKQLLEYLSGGTIHSKQEHGTCIYYSNRDQIAKTVIIDSVTQNIVHNETDSVVRELLVSLMVMQDFAYFSPSELLTLQMSMSGSYNSPHIEVTKIQYPPSLYNELRDAGLDPTIGEYTIGGYTYIFVNVDYATLINVPALTKKQQY
jgi:hypothetical protein